MKLLLLYNTRAGRKKGEGFLASLVKTLEGLVDTVEVRSPTKRGEMIELARTAATEGWDRVLAAGGDGTMNEVFTGVAGTDTVVGVIPLGTVNVFARDLGIPLDAEAAAKRAVEGEARRVTLGKVVKEGSDGVDRVFCFTCGAGLDGHTLTQEDLELKKQVGEAAYYWMTVKGIATFPGHPIDVYIDDDEPIRGNTVFVGNTPSYGGPYRIAPEADPFDPYVDVCLVKGLTAMRAARFMWSAKHGGTHVQYRWVEYKKAKRVRLVSKETVWAQLDGELYGTLPVEIHAWPEAVRLAL